MSDNKGAKDSAVERMAREQLRDRERVQQNHRDWKSDTGPYTPKPEPRDPLDGYGGPD